jgi:hypothetical protein
VPIYGKPEELGRFKIKLMDCRYTKAKKRKEMSETSRFEQTNDVV